jgi:tRNA dimethylallyltransferase
MAVTADQPVIHVVAGPTASGKSAYALKLAQSINGVIINADSLQIYDGLPLLTAQPSQADKDTVSHLLYAHSHPNDVLSAGRWRAIASAIIEQTLARGQTPIVTGGSGLYIKALIDGLSPIPETPESVRLATIQKFKELGTPGFHAALMQRDPVMAARFHPSHSARILRAWEVLETTGKSLAEWQEIPPIKPPEDWRFTIHKIMPERDILRQRCDQRFLTMIASGAIDEVKAFQTRIESGEIKANAPLTKALGFKQLRDYLKGIITLENAITQAQTETRQYAKRQTTWFKNQM